MPSPLSKLLRNTASNIVLKLLTIGLNFAYVPVMIGAIGASGFGLLTLATVLSGYFSLLGLGAPAGTTKYVAEFHARGEHDEVARVIATSLSFFAAVGVLIALGVVTFVLLGGLAIFHLEASALDEARTLFLWSAPIAALLWTSNALSATLEGFQEYHQKNLIVGGTQVVSLLAAVVVAIAGADLVTIYLAQNLTALMPRWILLWRAVQSHLGERRLRLSDSSRTTLKMILGLSVHMFVIQVAVLLNYSADEIILGMFLPVAAIAAYRVAAYPARLVQQLIAMFTSALMPAVSSIEATSGEAGRSAMIETGTRYNNMLFAPLVIAITALCPALIRLWVGPEFMALAWVAQASCLFQLVWQSNSQLGPVFFGTGRAGRFALVAVGGALVNVTASVFVAPHHGVAGVLLVTVAVGCLTVPLSYVVLFPVLAIERLSYLRTVVVAQLPSWLLGLALVPLWPWLEAIDNWLVFCAVGAAIVLAGWALGWRFVLTSEHRAWLGARIARRLPLRRRRS